MILIRRSRFLFCLFGACLIAFAGHEATAQQSSELVPGYWRGGIFYPRPDFGDLQRLRFLTDTGYPPFNYYDEEGLLTGFNVDLARAICDVLQVECVVRPGDWPTLLPALEGDRADAILASMAITPQSLAKADFTDRYYETPARFVARAESKFDNITPEALAGKKIVVVQNTAHEAYLRDFFTEAEIITVATPQESRKTLVEGKADLLFGDGISLVFWLNGSSSSGCCQFRGGPFYEAHYFGAGVGIAVRKGNRRMRDILNYALEQVRADGQFEELFLRYFPLSYLQ